MNFYGEDDLEKIIRLLTEIRDLLEEQRAVEFTPDFNIGEQEH